MQQYIKLFWLTIIFTWDMVFRDMSKVEASYDVLSRMIVDKDFDDNVVESQFLRFCQIDKTEWRLSRLLSKIGEHRPALLLRLNSLLVG